MAAKVAAPRAAKKSRQLVINILTGATEEDRVILETIRGTLVRPEIEKAVQGLETRLSERTASDGDDIAETIENALTARFEAFSNELKADVSTHVYQAVNQVKAQETKALQAQLEELGVGAVVDEAKGLISESLPPQMIQAQRILNMKVSKRYAADHPIEAQALEMGKLYLMQLLEGRLPTGGAETPSSGSSRGFGIR